MNLFPLLIIGMMLVTSFLLLRQDGTSLDDNWDNKQLMVNSASAPLLIDGDAQLAVSAKDGTGTSEDPYIIENLVINASGLLAHGIYISNTNKHLILRKSTILKTDNGRCGINLKNVTNCLLSRNWILSAGSDGIYVQNSSSIEIGNCFINSCKSGGIQLLYTPNNYIHHNVLSDNLDTAGIEITFSDNSTVTNNIVRGSSGGGMHFSHTDHLSIENNLVRENSLGVYSYQCNDGSVTNNLLISNELDGICLYWSNYISFRQNVMAFNNRHGIAVYSQSRYLNFTNNIILDNSEYGVSSGYTATDYNNYTSNTIALNGKHAIYIAGDYHVISYNTFFNNILGDTNITGTTGNVISGNTHDVGNDTDEDEFIDFEEIMSGTNPYLKDSDGDNLADRFEKNEGTDPLNFDSDFDGISDYHELNVHFTNPTSEDSDEDGLLDAEELFIYMTNPTVNDTDQDGLGDNQEINLGTNPRLGDSDSDNLQDGFEVQNQLDPLNKDMDGDGYLDGTEIAAGTDPNSASSFPGSSNNSLSEMILFGVACLVGFLAIFIALTLHHQDKKQLARQISILQELVNKLETKKDEPRNTPDVAQKKTTPGTQSSNILPKENEKSKANSI